MAKTLICSVGTSAAKAICTTPNLESWVQDQGDVGSAAQRILESIVDIQPSGSALREKLSAEIYSLVSIGIDTNDRIVLLASDTDGCVACAKAVGEYLKKHWPGICVVDKRISGLQVQNAVRFRREGVVEFTRHCLEEVNNCGVENVVLNPTGGFKALVPYTVLIGMLKRVPSRYIFEQSSSLLELPPLPINFDRAPFEAYRELFERIERETLIPWSDWESNVPYDERRLLEPLIEREGNQISLSGFGLLVMDEIKTPTEYVPFLSRKAWDDCLNNLSKLAQCEPFRFLERVAKSRQSFRLAEHLTARAGMRWLKPGNTTDRYLVSVEGWRLLVWRAIREDEVGKDYPNRITIDPKRERNNYAPFTRMEFVQ